MESALLTRLGDCKSSMECQLAVVRSLGNARLPGSVDALVQLSIKSKHPAVSEAALSSLTRVDADLILHSPLVCFLYSEKNICIVYFIRQQFGEYLITGL